VRTFVRLSFTPFSLLSGDELLQLFKSAGLPVSSHDENDSSGECSSDDGSMGSSQIELQHSDVHLSAADETKLKFIIDARNRSNVGNERPEISRENLRALSWRNGKSVSDVIQVRERIICAIEKVAQNAIKTGLIDEWFVDADVKSVSAGVNGPIMEALATIGSFTDMEALDILRRGVKLMGHLRHTDAGSLRAPRKKAQDSYRSYNDLMKANQKLLASL